MTSPLSAEAQETLEMLTRELDRQSPHPTVVAKLVRCLGDERGIAMQSMPTLRLNRLMGVLLDAVRQPPPTKDKTEAKRLRGLAQIYLDDGAPATALRRLHEALDIDPDDAETWHLYAQAAMTASMGAARLAQSLEAGNERRGLRQRAAAVHAAGIG